MPWSILLPILLDVLKKRYEAGFPWLMAFIDKLWGRIVKDVEKITVGMAAMVGDAPPEIQKMLEDLFTKLRDNAGLFMKGVYTILLQIVPPIADKIWDALFQAGHVTQPLSAFPAMVMTAAPQTEDDLIDALLAA